MSRLKTIPTVAFLLAASVSIALAQSGSDTVIHFTFDTASDLVAPEHMPNISGHDDGTLTLHQGGSISEQYSFSGHQSGSNGSTQQNRDRSGRLGGSLTPSWHVKSSSVLERYQSFPQNTRIWRVTIAGSSCRLDVIDKLKPGFKTYTFPRSRDGTIAYFANYRVTGTACSIR